MSIHISGICNVPRIRAFPVISRWGNNVFPQKWHKIIVKIIVGKNVPTHQLRYKTTFFHPNALDVVLQNHFFFTGWRFTVIKFRDCFRNKGWNNGFTIFTRHFLKLLNCSLNLFHHLFLLKLLRNIIHV